MRYWRFQAFRTDLDDGLGVCPTFAECCSQSLAVKSDLFRAGFVANTQKSIRAPVQSLRWLGYRWDLKDNLLTVPEDKIEKLLVSIDYALSQSSLPARHTHVQYTRTDSVRIFDVRSVRTVKEVTNREHLSYGPYVSFSSPGLHLIKDRAP